MSVRDLADYPWDAVVPFRERAAQHPEGLVDLSVGSPVDPTPELIRRALAEATDAHAYPQTVGTPTLREAIVEWYARRRGVSDLPRRQRVADDRLQGARRRCPRSSDSVRATSSCIREWRTRHTRSAPGWSVRRRSRPTIPPSGRRAPSSSGSTLRATRTAGPGRSMSSPRPCAVRASWVPSSRATSATPSWAGTETGRPSRSPRSSTLG